MSQNNNFAGGFFWGALLGGVVGGVIGTAIANRRANDDDPLLPSPRPLKLDTEEGIEQARRRLEDKIAQLNLAIDDVRQQLETVDESARHQPSSPEF